VRFFFGAGPGGVAVGLEFPSAHCFRLVGGGSWIRDGSDRLGIGEVINEEGQAP
jgi:hypothetical protein